MSRLPVDSLPIMIGENFNTPIIVQYFHKTVNEATKI
jgi:hypothetical protein